MARTIVTQDLIKKINELYLEIGTYAGVSRALGGTPSATTVKKYIIPNYVAEKDIKIVKFDKSLLSDDIDFTPFKNVEDWGDLCELSDEEYEEIKNLWSEIIL